eukprot:3594453-Pyramimonas_sp.AAC.1
MLNQHELVARGANCRLGVAPSMLADNIGFLVAPVRESRVEVAERVDGAVHADARSQRILGGTRRDYCHGAAGNSDFHAGQSAAVLYEPHDGMPDPRRYE